MSTAAGPGATATTSDPPAVGSTKTGEGVKANANANANASSPSSPSPSPAPAPVPKSQSGGDDWKKIRLNGDSMVTEMGSVADDIDENEGVSLCCRPIPARDLPKREILWSNPKKEFFTDVGLASDGGLSDVHELIHWNRRWFALLSVLFLFMNLYILTVPNIISLGQSNWFEKEGETTDDEVFLILRAILQGLFKVSIRPEALVAILEIMVVLASLASLLYETLNVCLERGFLRWHGISRIFLEDLVELQSVSALKMLSFVAPAIMVPALSALLRDLASNPNGKGYWIIYVRDLGSFVLWRLLAAIVGFDVFVVKFHAAVSGDGNSNWEDVFGHDVGIFVVNLLFLNQMLGIVQVTRFTQRRLMIFIFGGEDGIVTDTERAKQQVWRACLVKKMWEETRKRSRYMATYDFMAMMLTFSDYDFQHLVLKTKHRPDSQMVQVAKPPPEMDSKPTKSEDRIDLLEGISETDSVVREDLCEDAAPTSFFLTVHSGQQQQQQQQQQRRPSLSPSQSASQAGRSVSPPMYSTRASQLPSQQSSPRLQQPQQQQQQQSVVMEPVEVPTASLARAATTRPSTMMSSGLSNPSASASPPSRAYTTQLTLAAPPPSHRATTTPGSCVATSGPPNAGSALGSSPRGPGSVWDTATFEVVAFPFHRNAAPGSPPHQAAASALPFDSELAIALEPPGSQGNRNYFGNAASAYQALRKWEAASEFGPLSGAEAWSRGQALTNPDETFTGYGNSWRGMWATLQAKFAAENSAAVQQLVATGRAFLLAEDFDEAGTKIETGLALPNQLGLQMMLIRDALANCWLAPRSCSEMLARLIDPSTGALRSPEAGKSLEALLDRAQTLQRSSNPNANSNSNSNSNGNSYASGIPFPVLHSSPSARTLAPTSPPTSREPSPGAGAFDRRPSEPTWTTTATSMPGTTNPDVQLQSPKFNATATTAASAASAISAAASAAGVPAGATLVPASAAPTTSYLGRPSTGAGVQLGSTLDPRSLPTSSSPLSWEGAQQQQQQQQRRSSRTGGRTKRRSRMAGLQSQNSDMPELLFDD